MMNRMDILISIDNIQPGKGRMFEATRERITVRKRDDGTITIDGIPYFLESAVNIVSAIEPTDVYPSFEEIPI